MKAKRSHFSKIIRIRKQQLDWLKYNKDTRTIAGFLDLIINDFKKQKYEQL